MPASSTALASAPTDASSLVGVNIGKLCFTETAHASVRVLLSTCNYMFGPKTEGALPTTYV